MKFGRRREEGSHADSFADRVLVAIAVQNGPESDLRRVADNLDGLVEHAPVRLFGFRLCRVHETRWPCEDHRRFARDLLRVGEAYGVGRESATIISRAV